MNLTSILQNNTIRLILASVISVLLMLGIWNASYGYNCSMLIFPVMMWIVVAHSFIEVKMHERLCFKSCYFKENSFLATILSSRTFVVIVFMIISLAMTFSALYGSLEYTSALWIYLVIHIILSIFLYKFLVQRFTSMIKSSYLNIFAREWTINIMAALFILIFVYVSMYNYEPAYLRNGLSATMNAASNSISSQCEYLETILKLQKEIESVFWWVVHRSTENVEDTALKYMMWIIFLLMNSLAILGVNRFILQVIYLLDKLIIKDSYERG